MMIGEVPRRDEGGNNGRSSSSAASVGGRWGGRGAPAEECRLVVARRPTSDDAACVEIARGRGRGGGALAAGGDPSRCAGCGGPGLVRRDGSTGCAVCRDIPGVESGGEEGRRRRGSTTAGGGDGCPGTPAPSAGSAAAAPASPSNIGTNLSPRPSSASASIQKVPPSTSSTTCDLTRSPSIVSNEGPSGEDFARLQDWIQEQRAEETESQISITIPPEESRATHQALPSAPDPDRAELLIVTGRCIESGDKGPRSCLADLTRSPSIMSSECHLDGDFAKLQGQTQVEKSVPTPADESQGLEISPIVPVKESHATDQTTPSAADHDPAEQEIATSISIESGGIDPHNNLAEVQDQHYKVVVRLGENESMPDNSTPIYLAALQCQIEVELARENGLETHATDQTTPSAADHDPAEQEIATSISIESGGIDPHNNLAEVQDQHYKVVVRLGENESMPDNSTPIYLAALQCQIEVELAKENGFETSLVSQSSEEGVVSATSIIGTNLLPNSSLSSESALEVPSFTSSTYDLTKTPPVKSNKCVSDDTEVDFSQLQGHPQEEHATGLEKSVPIPADESQATNQATPPASDQDLAEQEIVTSQCIKSGDRDPPINLAKLQDQVNKVVERLSGNESSPKISLASLAKLQCQIEAELARAKESQAALRFVTQSNQFAATGNFSQDELMAEPSRAEKDRISLDDIVERTNFAENASLDDCALGTCISDEFLVASLSHAYSISQQEVDGTCRSFLANMPFDVDVFHISKVPKFDPSKVALSRNSQNLKGSGPSPPPFSGRNLSECNHSIYCCGGLAAILGLNLATQTQTQQPKDDEDNDDGETIATGEWTAYTLHTMDDSMSMWHHMRSMWCHINIDEMISTSLIGKFFSFCFDFGAEDDVNSIVETSIQGRIRTKEQACPQQPQYINRSKIIVTSHSRRLSSSALEGEPCLSEATTTTSTTPHHNHKNPPVCDHHAGSKNENDNDNGINGPTPKLANTTEKTIIPHNFSPHLLRGTRRRYPLRLRHRQRHRRTSHVVPKLAATS